ncbi:hypothetical protein SHKM778_70390 [Streptomyces sp. KM77-8]|uniref:Uncharacterized protein n=1 Tax=Streptomyces haneummycinicus TaxID=3074435 RepID=A0AAT9HTJ7_9ACTN
MVDDRVHRQVVAGPAHVPEAGHDAFDPPPVVGEGDVGDGVDVGGEEDDRDGAVVVEVCGQAQHPVGERLHAAVVVVRLHRAGVVHHQVDGGTQTVQAVLGE